MQTNIEIDDIIENINLLNISNKNKNITKNITKNKTKNNLDKTKKSKNSLIAVSGFKAEQIFRNDDKIITALEKYFKLKITKIQKIHNKKYDSIIEFENNTTVRIQNKKIENINGRGDSFDRRHIKYTFINQFIRKYLSYLTLFRTHKLKSNMSNEQKYDFIKICNSNLEDIKQYIKKTLLGEINEENEFWCIMKTDKNFNKIELYIITSKKLYDYIINSVNIDIKMKSNGTCLHLSPYISLQRKGGGDTDYAPNHIQAKFKITQDILNLCEKIL